MDRVTDTLESRSASWPREGPSALRLPPAGTHFHQDRLVCPGSWNTAPTTPGRPLRPPSGGCWDCDGLSCPCSPNVRDNTEDQRLEVGQAHHLSPGGCDSLPTGLPASSLPLLPFHTPAFTGTFPTCKANHVTLQFTITPWLPSACQPGLHSSLGLSSPSHSPPQHAPSWTHQGTVSLLCLCTCYSLSLGKFLQSSSQMSPPPRSPP